MTKLEQVARAIEDAGVDWLNRFGPTSDFPLGFADVPMAVLARAAISAMREPTPEMIEAGFIDTRYDAGYGSREDVCRAMIDQVLAEGGK